MRSPVGRAVVAVLLLGAGAALWTIGQAERRLADAHKDLATLQYTTASAEYGSVERSLRYATRVSGLGSAMLTDEREQRATAQYWRAAYAELTPERDASGAIVEHDAAMLFLAANAAYRSSQIDTSDRVLTARNLDKVAKAYADVLKSSPGHADAAYNYEFVVRKRGLLTQAHPMTLKADAPATIHGRPGAPPPEMDMKQFKLVIPKREEERDDPTAGKGGVKVRKG